MINLISFYLLVVFSLNIINIHATKIHHQMVSLESPKSKIPVHTSSSSTGDHNDEYIENLEMQLKNLDVRIFIIMSIAWMSFYFISLFRFMIYKIVAIKCIYLSSCLMYYHICRKRHFNPCGEDWASIPIRMMIIKCKIIQKKKDQVVVVIYNNYMSKLM